MDTRRTGVPAEPPESRYPPAWPFHQVWEHAADGLRLTDELGLVRKVNPAYCRLVGRPRSELEGQPFSVIFAPGRQAPSLRRYRRQFAARAIRPHLRHEATLWNGKRVWLETSNAFLDREGRPSLLFTIARDVSQRRRAEQSLRQRYGLLSERRRAEALLAAQQEAARALAEATALPDAAPAVLRAVAANLGWDLGVLWEVDRCAAVLRGVALWHARAGDVREAERFAGRASYPLGVGLPGHVAASGQPVWLADVPAEAPLAALAAAVAPEGLHGAVAVPVRGRGDTLGVVAFFSRAAREPDGAVLDLLTGIGRQTGQLMERLRAERALDEREAEFDLARQIQQGLLPRAVQAPAGFALGGASCPAHKAGGDYFDFIPMPGGYLGVVVGDASGHGVGAALVMAETRAYLRALALEHKDIRRIVTVTNRRLAEDIGEGHFVTLFLARLNPVTRMLVYSNAGHWPGYVLDAHGDVKMVLHSTDGPLGLDPATAFSTARALVVEPGDLLFLYTDGIVEALAPDGAPFGKARALRLVGAHRGEQPDAIIRTLFDEVRAFCGGAQTDDMTAVVIKVAGPAPGGGPG